MHITAAMIEAARRAEYDYYQKGRQLGTGRFIPTPDPVIRAMLEAGLRLAGAKIAETEPAPQAQPAKMPHKVVWARLPRRRRPKLPPE